MDIERGNEMKFDAVIGNPPFQMPKRDGFEHAGSASLWPRILLRAIAKTENDGFICMIHPQNWRGIGKTNCPFMKRIRKTMRSLDINHIHCSSNTGADKRFNASTRWDWHVTRKRAPHGRFCRVRGTDGRKGKISIEGIGLIRSCGYKSHSIEELFAKPGKRTTNIKVGRSCHGDDFSEIRTDEFNHPWAFTISAQEKGEVNIMWGRNKGPCAGIPKVIYGKKDSPGIPFADIHGYYSLGSMTVGLIDKPKRLKRIARAMDSKKFRKMMNQAFLGSAWNHHAIRRLRRNFWKEFP